MIIQIYLHKIKREIKARLESRVSELTEQMNSVKMLVFDSKVQFKSNEISESTFESVKIQTTDIIEHISHEQSEISNVQKRLEDLSMEVQTTEAPRKLLQEEAESYLGTQSESEVQTKLPEVPEQTPEAPIAQPSEQSSEQVVTLPQVSAGHDAITTSPEQKSEESDWLARMQAQ